MVAGNHIQNRVVGMRYGEGGVRVGEKRNPTDGRGGEVHELDELVKAMKVNVEHFIACGNVLLYVWGIIKTGFLLTIGFWLGWFTVGLLK